MDSPRRRRFLQAGVGVSALALAGCSQLPSELTGDRQGEPPGETDTTTSSSTPVPEHASFSFDYSSGSLTIRLTSDGPIPASNLVIRSSEGTQVRWHELGSTAVPASESVMPGDTATIGSSVLNWPSEVSQTETIRAVFMSDGGSPTTLATFEPSAENTESAGDDTESSAEDTSGETPDWPVDISFETTGLGYSDEFVFASARGETQKIHKVDPNSETVVDSYDKPSAAGNISGVTVIDEYIWMVDWQNSGAYRIHKETGDTEYMFDVLDPSGIGYDAGSIWICEIAGNSVMEYDESGNRQSEFSISEQTFTPKGLGVYDGDIYVGDAAGNRSGSHIYTFSQSGELIEKIGTDDKNTGITGSPYGVIYPHIENTELQLL